MSGYVDTHSHLAMLEHSPLEEILGRAEAAGVTRMLSVSVDPKSWRANRDLANRLPNVWWTIGLHPHDAKDWESCRAQLLAYFEAPDSPDRCVAIGEMGLDFHYDNSPRDQQLAAFEDQARIAKEKSLPIVIHCRDAFDELYGSLRRHGLGARGGVMHCFTGGPAEAKAALDIGLHISFAGIVTFKTAESLRQAARIVPLDRILVETDCPFLAPVPYRGKPNEPAYLPRTAETLAMVKGIAVEELRDRMAANATTLFRL